MEEQSFNFSLSSFQHFVFFFHNDYPDLILNKLEEFSILHVCNRNEILQTLQKKTFQGRSKSIVFLFFGSLACSVSLFSPTALLLNKSL